MTSSGTLHIIRGIGDSIPRLDLAPERVGSSGGVRDSRRRGGGAAAISISLEVDKGATIICNPSSKNQEPGMS
jgi:hypothetical protein